MTHTKMFLPARWWTPAEGPYPKQHHSGVIIDILRGKLGREADRAIVVEGTTLSVVPLRDIAGVLLEGMTEYVNS